MASTEEPIPRYWDWVAGVLFLLITVDVLTTVYAAAAAGVVAEANPLIRWALGRGITAYVAVNIAATLLLVGFFYALVELLDGTAAPYRRPFALAVEVFIGLLLFAGLAVFANNVSVIVLGESLL